MIKKVVVDSFKCFDHLEVEFKRLNVFSGINNTGKSTFIQSLLLLRQSNIMKAIDQGLYLNGALINLGNGKDLLNRYSNTDVITIEIMETDKVVHWEYRYNPNSDFLLLKQKDGNFDINNWNLFNADFEYISADRIGPQRFYQSSYFEVFNDNNGDKQGYYLAGIMQERGNETITNSAVLHKNCNSKNLLSQTEAWLSEISGDIKIQPEKYMEGLYGINYSIDREKYTPVNMGFGISYVAPIVVGLLRAKPGSMLIIENPEAHLHPRGQRIMGELISKAAHGGVQVVLETHSDHLLNGIRLSVKKRQIDNKEVAINYFYSEIDKFEYGNRAVHKMCNPCILDDGSLSAWPDGFFDEWDKALEELI